MADLREGAKLSVLRASEPASGGVDRPQLVAFARPVHVKDVIRCLDKRKKLSTNLYADIIIYLTLIRNQIL